MKHTQLFATIIIVATLLLCVDAAKQTFRFVHAIPDSGPVDVRIGGKIIFNDVKFGTITPSTVLSPTDLLNVTITTTVGKNTLLQDGFTFQQPLTVAAVGTLNDEVNPATLVGYLDFPNISPDKKNAAVRAINLIVNSPELIVESTKIIQGTASLLNETLPFGVPTDYELVPASIYNLIITTSDQNNLIYKPGVTFTGRNFYSIFLFGDYSSEAASMTALDAIRQGNFATFGAKRNLFLNIVNDDKQLIPVNTVDEL